MNTENSSANDPFELFEKIYKRYFLELEQNVPHIQQSLFDLQNEYYKVWKNNVASSISLQKEFFKKSGFNYDLLETSKNIIDNMSEETIKFRSIFHKIIIANIEQGKNYAKTLNNNSNTFLDLNKNLTQYWASIYSGNQDG